eukprot:6214574-Pleurochrysis_carterae.AAC.2
MIANTPPSYTKPHDSYDNIFIATIVRRGAVVTRAQQNFSKGKYMLPPHFRETAHDGAASEHLFTHLPSPEHEVVPRKRGPHSRVGRDGRWRRTSRRGFEGLHRVHPPDRIGEPTARVPPPQVVTYAGKGPERVREGGRRGPPSLGASSPCNLEREGCASAHAGVGRPRQGERADQSFAAAAASSRSAASTCVSTA